MLMVIFLEAHWNSKPVPLRFRCSVAKMESLILLPLSPVHCVTVQVSAKPNYWSKTISNNPHSPTKLGIWLNVCRKSDENSFITWVCFWNDFVCCCHSSYSRGKLGKTNGSWWVERSIAVFEHHCAAIWAVHFLSQDPKWLPALKSSLIIIIS